MNKDLIWQPLARLLFRREGQTKQFYKERYIRGCGLLYKVTYSTKILLQNFDIDSYSWQMVARLFFDEVDLFEEMSINS